jgi:hypothetical protein
MPHRLRNNGLQTPAYWRERADEAEGMAEAMVDLRAKATMQAIAYKYRLMAELTADSRKHHTRSAAESSTGAGNAKPRRPHPLFAGRR